MKRIILHWSAGANRASTLDRDHYHMLIESDGRLVYGKHEISANKAPITGQYAAHTLNCNTDSIGIAVCAMAGAVESPFNPGKYPITETQVRVLAREVARLANGYGIPVTRQTVLSHAEVQPTLGIAQRGKWDISWLPGMTKPGDPVAVGDVIRKLVAEELAGNVPVQEPAKPDADALLRAVHALITEYLEQSK